MVLASDDIGQAFVMLIAMGGGLVMWYFIFKGVAKVWSATPDVVKDAAAKAAAKAIKNAVK